MIIGGVAKRYARAVAEVAEAAGVLDRVGQELDQLAGFIRQSLDFQRLLLDPGFQAGERQTVFKEIAARTGWHEITSSFIRVLIEERRLGELERIAAAVWIFADERAGRVRVEVASAAPLSLEIIEKLKKNLASRLGKSITLSQKIQPALIGGLVTTVGGIVYDGSLLTRLTRLKENLLSGSGR